MNIIDEINFDIRARKSAYIEEANRLLDAGVPSDLAKKNWVDILQTAAIKGIYPHTGIDPHDKSLRIIKSLPGVLGKNAPKNPGPILIEGPPPSGSAAAKSLINVINKSDKNLKIFKHYEKAFDQIKMVAHYLDYCDLAPQYFVSLFDLDWCGDQPPPGKRHIVMPITWVTLFTKGRRVKCHTPDQLLGMREVWLSRNLYELFITTPDKNLHAIEDIMYATDQRGFILKYVPEMPQDMIAFVRDNGNALYWEKVQKYLAAINGKIIARDKLIQ
jgi:hypothetical protein